MILKLKSSLNQLVMSWHIFFLCVIVSLCPFRFHSPGGGRGKFDSFSDSFAKAQLFAEFESGAYPSQGCGPRRYIKFPRVEPLIS